MYSRKHFNLGLIKIELRFILRLNYNSFEVN